MRSIQLIQLLIPIDGESLGAFWRTRSVQPKFVELNGFAKMHPFIMKHHFFMNYINFGLQIMKLKLVNLNAISEN